MVSNRVCLTLVMFLWALCFPLISVGLTTAPPIYFAALRSLIAGLGLLLPAFALHRPLPHTWQIWLILLGVGLTSTSLGFGGMFLGGGRLSPGLATVIANAQPLIAACIAYFALNEQLGLRRGIGIFLGFVGIILTTLPEFATQGISGSVSGVGYILLGALGVAVGNVLLKRLGGQVDPLVATAWQFILGGIPLFLVALSLEKPTTTTWAFSFIITLLVLSLVGTALAFVLWVGLLCQGDLNRLNAFTFLTPIFALLIGTLFFNEKLAILEITGAILSLVSIFWVDHR
ncbi:MAG: DMT family transporter [Chloroflexi bacterium]|nr:DMT family transporter [Chloroflexota bacterium]